MSRFVFDGSGGQSPRAICLEQVEDGNTLFIISDWTFPVLSSSHMNPFLERDYEYTKNEIENIFDTNFGTRIKGITLRRWADGTPYIILFSRANDPYADQMDGHEFLYDREGIDKDQTYTTVNKVLAESGTTRRAIYGFRQDIPNGK